MVGTVLGQRGPAGEERPDRALVIAEAVVDFLGVGDVARTPVGVEGGGDEVPEAVFTPVEDRLTRRRVPPGEGGIDGGGAIVGAVGVVAEGVAAFFRVGVFGVDGLGDEFGSVLRAFSFGIVAELALDPSHGGRGLLIEEGEIDFLMGHAAGPALYPAGALRIVVDAVVIGVVRGIGFEGPGFLDGIAMGGEEGVIARASHVVGDGEQEQRCGVGGGVHVREGLPVDGGGGLGVLMHDFAVGALAVDEEFKLGLGKSEVAEAVDGVEGVEGVAAKEPAEAGACGVGGGEVAGDECGRVSAPFFVLEGVRRRGALAGDGLGFELFDGDDGPQEGFVECLIGGLDGGGVGEKVLPGFRVGCVESGDLRVELGECSGEGCVGGGGGRDAGGHQQREELFLVLDRVNV